MDHGRLRQDWGDSGIEEDTDGEHEVDDSDSEAPKRHNKAQPATVNCNVYHKWIVTCQRRGRRMFVLDVLFFLHDQSVVIATFEVEMGVVERLCWLLRCTTI